MTQSINIQAGHQYGNWTAIKRVANQQGNRCWLCECRCGATGVVRSSRLANPQSNNSCLQCAVGGGYEEISGDRWSRIRYSAQERQLDFEVTIEQAWNLFIEQDRRCAITDLPLSFDREDRTASLDRIDSHKGYVVGNIQWVHKDINSMKMNLQEERFIELCRLVAYSPKTIWR